MKLSIVTPSFNGLRFLDRTARSILSQSGDFELEWIVVDGGSTDGTVEFLRGLNDPRLRWTSEADRGQSHAINKGLALAAGDVVAWLNTDDVYTPGALAAVAQAFAAAPEAQWLVGRYEVIDEADRPIRSGVVRYKERSLRRYTYRALLRENFISQPAVFWRREFGHERRPAGRVAALDDGLRPVAADGPRRRTRCFSTGARAVPPAPAEQDGQGGPPAVRRAVRRGEPVLRRRPR